MKKPIVRTAVSSLIICQKCGDGLLISYDNLCKKCLGYDPNANNPKICPVCGKANHKHPFIASFQVRLCDGKMGVI